MAISSSTGRLLDVFLLRAAGDAACGCLRALENVVKNASTALPLVESEMEACSASCVLGSVLDLVGIASGLTMVGVVTIPGCACAVCAIKSDVASVRKALSGSESGGRPSPELHLLQMVQYHAFSSISAHQRSP
jgi:uncharacterized membrane protein